MNRLTLMFRYDDVARADIALTADKIYYRFATDDSIEDGELPVNHDDFDRYASSLLNNLQALATETDLDPKLKVEIFVDNRKSEVKLSRQSICRAVEALQSLAHEFVFLNGFCI